MKYLKNEQKLYNKKVDLKRLICLCKKSINIYSYKNSIYIFVPNLRIENSYNR